MTYDLDLQFPASYGHDLVTCNNSQSVPKIEWKQTDGRSDRRTDGDDCITCRINAVGKIATKLFMTLLLTSEDDVIILTDAAAATGGDTESSVELRA